MFKRILTCILLLLSILFLPFWISVILAFAGVMYFSIFLEAVFLFLLSDLLYGVSEPRFFDITFVSFFIAVLLLVIGEVLKRKLKFYP